MNAGEMPPNALPHFRAQPPAFKPRFGGVFLRPDQGHDRASRQFARAKKYAPGHDRGAHKEDTQSGIAPNHIYSCCL
jgi:hypothetical protein